MLAHLRSAVERPQVPCRKAGWTGRSTGRPWRARSHFSQAGCVAGLFLW